MTGTTFITARFDEASGHTGDDRSILPWWSFAKTVLAVAALKLVSQGRLTLDESIAGRPYTLRQLLQHRSGITDYGSLKTYHEAVASSDEPWSIERLLEETNADELEFTPGQGWRYSNIGYLFVRQIIEHAMGMELGDALRKLVFDELEMEEAILVTTPEQLERTTWRNQQNYHPGWVYHGLLVGTPRNAVSVLHALMTGKLLPQTLLQQMTTPHGLGGPLPGRPWLTTGYGLGLMIGEVETASLIMGHSGGGPKSVSAIYHFKELKFPTTVASFTLGDDDGANEFEAVRIATQTR